MLKEIAPHLETILLVVLTIMQLGRWVQKREDTPEELAKKLGKLEQLEDKRYEEFRRLRHDYNNDLQTRDWKNDQRYIRKDVFEAKEKAQTDTLDAQCDRITDLEHWQKKMVGI